MTHLQLQDFPKATNILYPSLIQKVGGRTIFFYPPSHFLNRGAAPVWTDLMGSYIPIQVDWKVVQLGRVT